MASSKNSNILIDTPQIIKRTRAQLRKLETPSMIKIEIPDQQNLETPRKTRKRGIALKKKVELVMKDTPRRTRNTKQILKKEMTVKKPGRKSTKRTRNSKLSIQTQIELANEVVRMQLAKKVQKIKEPQINETVKEEVDTQIKPDVNSTLTNGNPRHAKVSSLRIKATPSKVTKKAAINKTEAVKRPLSESPKATNKRPADSTQSPAKIRKVTKAQTPKKKQPAKKASPLQRKSNPPRKKSAAGKEKLNDTVSGAEKCLPELSIIKVESPNKVDDNLLVTPIVSRKNSNASSSNLSWTKDISSSSTTTCVTVQSHDFVRIDNKLPIIKVTNVDSQVNKCKKAEENDNTTSNSESTSSSDTSACDYLLDLYPDSLDLSTSSLSVVKADDPPKHQQQSIKGDMSKVVGILSSRLKNFDKEIMRWIGLVENIDNETKKFNDKIMKVLKEENNVIINCRLLKNLLSNRPPEYVDNLDERLNAPTLPEENDSSDNPISKDNDLLNQNAEYLYSPKTPSLCTDSDGEHNSDHFNCTSFDRNENDDDALSIFAESITGIDSKSDDLNCSSDRADDFDEIDTVNQEDLPQPLDTSQTPEPMENIQAKIIDTEAVKKNVCEKQNADSTSIYKEPECGAELSEGEIEENACDDDAEVCNSPGNSFENTETPNQINPLHVTSIFHPTQPNQSDFFQGICFNNLFKACKNQRCSYTHRAPTKSEVEKWLITLSELSFIKEYAYMRMRLNLRRKYGMCFVKECFRRGLIRNLVEIAIDFIIAYKPNHLDMILQNKVLEYILEALNNVGLVVYEDLFNCPIDGSTCLSHVLMSVMAHSQNFTRFKQVFTNLTNVMVRHQQTFNMNVAVSLLERICVLPSEEPLLRAIFNIIKNTDPLIFHQKIMGALEARLKTIESPWLNEFLAVKNHHVPAPVVVMPTASPKAVNLEPLNVNSTNNDEERYTSPDTTNVDALQNNLMSEPPINRTVSITRTCYNTQTPTHLNEDWKSNKFNNLRHNATGRTPPPLIPSLFARPVFRQRGHRYNYRTSHINYRPRPHRNF